MEKPTHPYTQALLSAIPKPQAAGRQKRIVLSGELPDPAHPPSGCPFHTRCPYVMPICRTDPPGLVPRRHDQEVREAACHLYPALA
jgi:oligopeptide/dipeptide ABC transporter ATP-binding protein